MNSSIDLQTKYKVRESTDYIVVHHSNTTRRQRCDAFDIHRKHLSDGYSSIGFHFVIEKDGTLRSGRPVNVMGAHCKGHDHNTVAVCMVGGLDKDGKVVDNFDNSQYKTLQTLVILLQEIYPDATLVKHSNLEDTKCLDVDLTRLEGHIR